MDFWDRLEKEIASKSNRKAVMMEAGIAANSVTTWRKRGTIPSAGALVKIGKALSVTVEYLVTGEDSTDPWYHDHRQLFADLEALPAEQLRTVAGIVHGFAEEARARKSKQLSAEQVDADLDRIMAQERTGLSHGDK